MYRKYFMCLALCLIMAIPVLAESNVAFGGYRYDNGPMVSFGFGKELGYNLYSFNYFDVGNYQTMNNEIVWMQNMDFVTKNLYGGLLAGPSTEWTGTAADDSLTTIARVGGAVGGIVSYNFYSFNILGEQKTSVGLWAYAKQKFDLEDDSDFKDGFIWGGGLHLVF